MLVCVLLKKRSGKMCQQMMTSFLFITLAFIAESININRDISYDIIQCEFDSDCIVTCNATNQCTLGTIYCHNRDNGVCKLICTDTQACIRTALIAKDVQSVEIICGIHDTTSLECSQLLTEIRLKDELSTLNIICNGHDSCYNSDIMVETHSLGINSDNYILSNIGVPRVNIQCQGNGSCKGSIIAITGTNNFELNCTNSASCDDIQLTVSSYNNTNPTGILTVNCYQTSCVRSIFNGISVKTVNINCIQANSCASIKVISIFLTHKYIHQYNKIS